MDHAGTESTEDGELARRTFNSRTLRPLCLTASGRGYWLLVFVLLLAAVLRLYGLNNYSPPGLEHDEVANWLIDRSILAGNHAIYFTEAYGHEAGFHYLQATFVALLGDHALALRLPAAFSGLLLVAVCYALARILFGWRVALLAAALLAVLFWPVFYSRLGLRAITLPLLSGLSAYCWWRGWGVSWHDPARRPLRWFSLAGLFAGLSLHTYMAARVVPIFYALFLAYLALWHRDRLRARWRGVFLFWLLLLLVAAPLAIYLLRNPGAEYRIGEIDAPLRALRAGNVRPVVDNAVDILAMFGVRGDPLWRQNVASWPVFDPITAAFFYACVLLCFLRVRDARYLFLILWILTATIPSVVTIDAPSTIRISNILPLLTILPAIIMHSLGRLSTEKRALSTGVRITTVLAVALVVLHLVRTAQAIFFIWPAQEEVQFVWQEALTEVADYLDTAPSAGPVAVGGWTPETMDPPTMALSLRRQDLSLRFFQPQQALTVPASAAPAQPVRIFLPAILPLHPLLQREVEAWQATTLETETFTQYTVAAMPAVRPETPAGAIFGGELLFLGYTFSEECQPLISQPCQLLTYWRVLDPAGAPRSFFLHAYDGAGALVTTGDALGAPAGYWQAGDLIIQRHELALESVIPYTLRLGVYNPDGGRRLLTTRGDDHIVLESGQR